MKLRFDMMDKDGVVASAEYSYFIVQPGSTNYRMHVGPLLSNIICGKCAHLLNCPLVNC